MNWRTSHSRGSSKFTYISHNPTGIKQILADTKSNNSVWNNKSKSGGDTEELKKNRQVKHFSSGTGNRWKNIVSGKMPNIEKCNKSGHCEVISKLSFRMKINVETAKDSLNKRRETVR